MKYLLINYNILSKHDDVLNWKWYCFMFTHIFWFLRFIFLLFLSFYFPFLTIKQNISKPKKYIIIMQIQIQNRQTNLNNAVYFRNQKINIKQKKIICLNFLCTALRRSHDKLSMISKHWTRHKSTNLFAAKNKINSILCVCACAFWNIYNISNTNGGSTTDTNHRTLLSIYTNIQQKKPKKNIFH